jgi:phosphoribosyl 1,2-cyclic phosphodiesterase
VAFVIETEGMRIGHCTDIGYPTELARHNLRGCNLLLLESNHDYRMLIDGPYPWPVKQRIMGRTGHLNNEVAAELLAELYHDDLLAVRLAHMSQENNCSQLVQQMAVDAIAAKANGNQVDIRVLEQGGPVIAMQY